MQKRSQAGRGVDGNGPLNDKYVAKTLARKMIKVTAGMINSKRGTHALFLFALGLF